MVKNVPGALSNEATLTLNNLTMADAGNFTARSQIPRVRRPQGYQPQVKAIDEVYNQ
jgi:hypothetical protein